MPDNAPLVFKHERYIVAAFNLVLITAIPFFVWMTFYSFFFYTGIDVVEVRIVCLALLIFSPMFFIGRIYAGDIHVDDEGIGWWAWGRRWRYIRWTDVKAITVKTIAAYNQIPPTQTSYCLYTTDNMSFYHSQRYGMRFDDHIPNAKALIDAVDGYVRRHNILVLDRRGKTEVRRSNLGS
jgi:hypothetical protein